MKVYVSFIVMAEYILQQTYIKAFSIHLDSLYLIFSCTHFIVTIVINVHIYKSVYICLHVCRKDS